VFLGQYEQYDLYLHLSNHEDTLIARYGGGGDYTSGLSFVRVQDSLYAALVAAAEYGQCSTNGVTEKLKRALEQHGQFREGEITRFIDGKAQNQKVIPLDWQVVEANALSLSKVPGRLDTVTLFDGPEFIREVLWDAWAQNIVYAEVAADLRKKGYFMSADQFRLVLQYFYIQRELDFGVRKDERLKEKR
jgi:hypothetical protein